MCEEYCSTLDNEDDFDLDEYQIWIDKNPEYVDEVLDDIISCYDKYFTVEWFIDTNQELVLDKLKAEYCDNNGINYENSYDWSAREYGIHADIDITDEDLRYEFGDSYFTVKDFPNMIVLLDWTGMVADNTDY